MKVLCVAEKPSIAKSISQILSSNDFSNRVGKDKYCRNYDFKYRFNGQWCDFTVTSVRGHLTSNDFTDAHRKWNACDPAALFEAPIVVRISDDSKKIADNLRAEVRGAGMLMIWTDCDREGEHIGAEVVRECQKVNRNATVKRAKFSAIIPAQIHNAAQNPVELDWAAAAAVEARQELDLRIGAAFTRMQTTNLQRRFHELNENVVSYGPCQFPTLGFVVDRYIEVMSFVPEPFWYIDVMHKRDDKEVHFKWSKNHLFDEEAVRAIYERCRDDPQARVTKVFSRQTKKFKCTPLTTVDLQKSASRLLHLSPKRILDIAESLYQKGLLSYPRTETDQYDKAFDFKALIEKQKADGAWGTFATRLNDGGEFERPRDGRKNDKAHPPIHPTMHANNLSGDDKRVYDYVVRRFLGSCHKDAVGLQTTVDIEISKEAFKATGLVIQARNYLEVFIFDTWNGTLLPTFTEGETFVPTEMTMKAGETTAPKLLTEADLVSLMDRNGIGTDATIAEHIAKVIERDYVMTTMEGRVKYLLPSTLGMGLVEGYNGIDFEGEKSLSKPQLRREMEERMERICGGQSTKRETIDESLHEYRLVYAMAKQKLDVVISSVAKYVRGEEPEAAPDGEARGDDAPPAPPGGGGGGGNNGRGGPPRGGDGPPPAPRAAPAARRNPSPQRRDPPPAARNQRPPANQPAVISISDSEDDDDNNGGRGGGRVAAGRAAAPAAPARRAAASGNGARGGGGGGGVQCRCGEDAVERTVTKDGANKGKLFFSCAKPRDDGSCGFFEWVENAGSAGGAGASNAAGPSRAGGRAAAGGSGARGNNASMMDRYRENLMAVDEEPDVRRCKCKLEARMNTVTKEGPNTGRRFFGCAKESREAQCGYFEWEDEAGEPGVGGGGPSRGGGGGGGASGSCFKCGEEGHWSNSCPNEDASNGAGGGGGGGGGGSGECFQCGETGHWSKDCPERGGGSRGKSSSSRGAPSRRANTSGGAGGKSGECFKCGQEGHWSSDCPGDNAGSNKRSYGGGSKTTKTTRTKRGAAGGGGANKRRKS